MEDAPHNVKCVGSLRDRDRWLAGVTADAKLTLAAVRVANSLALHLNIKSGRCDPGIVRLTERCAFKDVRSVERAIRALEDAGWVSHISGHGKQTNRYSLLMARVIEEADPTDAPGHCDEPPDDTPGLNDESPGEWGASPGGQHVHPRTNVRTNREGNSVKRNTEGNNDGGDIPRADGSKGKKAGTKGVDLSIVQTHFDVFWSIYPKRVGRSEAELKFAAALKHGADPNVIIAAARSYAAEKRGVAEKYIKFAANWLYAEPWRDPPAAPDGGVTLDERGNVVEMRPPPRRDTDRPTSVLDMARRMYSAGGHR